jgi:hypothetical protein
MPEWEVAAIIEPQVMEIEALNRRQSRAFRSVEALFGFILRL